MNKVHERGLSFTVQSAPLHKFPTKTDFSHVSIQYKPTVLPMQMGSWCWDLSKKNPNPNHHILNHYLINFPVLVFLNFNLLASIRSLLPLDLPVVGDISQMILPHTFNKEENKYKILTSWIGKLDLNATTGVTRCWTGGDKAGGTDTRLRD